jgi:hypothetical protein
MGGFTRRGAPSASSSKSSRSWHRWRARCGTDGLAQLCTQKCRSRSDHKRHVRRSPLGACTPATLHGFMHRHRHAMRLPPRAHRRGPEDRGREQSRSLSRAVSLARRSTRSAECATAAYPIDARTPRPGRTASPAAAYRSRRSAVGLARLPPHCGWHWMLSRARRELAALGMPCSQVRWQLPPVTSRSPWLTWSRSLRPPDFGRSPNGRMAPTETIATVLSRRLSRAMRSRAKQRCRYRRQSPTLTNGSPSSSARSGHSAPSGPLKHRMGQRLALRVAAKSRGTRTLLS